MNGRRGYKYRLTVYPHLKIGSSFPGVSEVKASACKAEDLGSIPGLGRSPGEGNGNPLQYSCLENPMDRGAWRATVHGVTESQTRLSNFTFTPASKQILYHLSYMGSSRNHKPRSIRGRKQRIPEKLTEAGRTPCLV